MISHLERLRAALAAQELPALLVSAPANRRYVSGFRGSFGALLVTAEQALIFTDGRYVPRVAGEAPGFALRQVVNPERPLLKLLVEAIGELAPGRVGFEAAHMSVAEHGQLAQALAQAGVGVELHPTEGVVEGLREVKDAAELATLRRAIAITDAAITAVLPALRPDHTERQAAWMLEVALRERGAEALAFPIIVAAGPNGAAPHASVGDEPLGLGRPIVIDMGARVDGYHGDLTRTVVLGEPDAQFWAIYDLVLQAQRRAIAGLRPGLTCAAADALARDLITEAGYGPQFSHGLGHGVGLNIHEGPGLRRALPDTPSAPLQPGMVTSVEPGIYIEGWGGVRIEDLVLITDAGCAVLSAAPKMSS